MNIYNKWVGDIPDDARSFDGDLSDVSPMIISLSSFGNVRTVTVTFKYYLDPFADEKTEDEEEEDEPEDTSGEDGEEDGGEEQ